MYAGERQVYSLCTEWVLVTDAVNGLFADAFNTCPCWLAACLPICLLTCPPACLAAHLPAADVS